MNTIIDLIRHGEPEGGARYRGHAIDDPLSAKGWQEMWAGVGEHAPWQHILTSPMRRCREFANALGARHNLPVRVEPDLREIGFGAWEGLSKNEVKQRHGLAQYQAFCQDPVNCRPPGAEDLGAFIERTSQVYIRATQNFVGQHLLMVAHAGVIRALVAHVLQAPPQALYRIKVDTGHVSRIFHDEFSAKLEFHNRYLD
jgi:alpha-ribazole phosphatase